MGRIVLVIDCGTQSIRTMLVDNFGNIKGKEQSKYEYITSDNDEIFEFDVSKFYELIIKLIKQLKNNHLDIFKRIEGVTITTQRDTFVLVDKNGIPTRNAISWLDRRKAKNYKQVPLLYNFLFSIVKMKDQVKTYMEEARYNWVIENEPEVWKKTYKYLLLPQYLNYKFIGKYIESDGGTVGHIPFSYKKRKYDWKYGVKSQIFNIDRSKLANIGKSTSILGYIKKDLCIELGLKENTPLIASGSDKACETTGVGCINEGLASISLASQVTFQTTTYKYYELTKFIPPFDSIIPGMYNPEIILYRGFWLISWFIKEFGYKEQIFSDENDINIFDIMEEKLNEIPAGCDGLILQPFWGQDILRPDAKGSILGFNDKHSRFHIYKAIIEGIGYTLKEGLDKIEKVSKVKINQVALSGGGSTSDAVCQIMSDILNRPVYIIQTHEASAIGAAMAAFIGLNVYSNFDEAKNNMVRIKKEYYPNKETSKKYYEIYNKVYKKIYSNVKKIFRKINSIDY